MLHLIMRYVLFSHNFAECSSFYILIQNILIFYFVKQLSIFSIQNNDVTAVLHSEWLCNFVNIINFIDYILYVYKRLMVFFLKIFLYVIIEGLHFLFHDFVNIFKAWADKKLCYTEYSNYGCFYRLFALYFV